MTRLSKLRSRLFAYKLTSSTSDNFTGSDRIDTLLTQARLVYETMLSQTSGERIDQRRSAMKGQVTYRQGVVAPAAVVLVLDINLNRQYHKSLLQKINQIINYTITSCEQLGLECIIIYPHEGEAVEYVCEGLESTIQHLNQILQNTADALLTTSLRRYHNEYYEHHAIIVSDRLSWDSEHNGDQIQNLIQTQQVIGYIRDYPSPIVHRGAIPEGLIQLKR